MLLNGFKDEDSASVISIIGVFNTIGMISLGYIGDQPWLNVPKTYACCLFSRLNHNFYSTIQNRKLMLIKFI